MESPNSSCEDIVSLAFTSALNRQVLCWGGLGGARDSGDPKVTRHSMYRSISQTKQLRDSSESTVAQIQLGSPPDRISTLLAMRGSRFGEPYSNDVRHQP